MIYINQKNYFKYDMVGEFISGGDWRHPKRTIQSHELILVLKGQVFIEEDGVQYTLSPDNMIILEPNKLHHGFKNSGDGGVSFYWLHFVTDLPLPFKTYSGKDYYEIKQLVKQLLHITNTAGYSVSAADAAALMVFEEMKKLGCESTMGSTLISRVVEYIRINIKKDVTVKSIAEYLGYNSDYLGKLFKKYDTRGLKNYIATQRIKAIKDMLLTTDMTVKQIAFEFGYRDENTLLKFFIYHEKITPTYFRNTYCNTHLNNK